MRHHRFVLAAGLVAVLAGCGGSGAVPSTVGSIGGASPVPSESAISTPVIASPAASSPSLAPSASAPSRPLGDLGPLDPRTFSTTVDNRWFPLVPGTSWTLTGVKDRKRAEDVFEVLPKTEVVAGVTCVIVQDDLSLNGVPRERTTGYFAQHQDGSVWFFGEDVHKLDSNGRVVSLAGSWRAGLDGAVPGLTMPADPKAGDSFDQITAHAGFEVLAVDKSVKVPAGTFPMTLLIEESDPEEPGIKARKYYAPGLGEVRDVSVGGPLEEMKLAEYRRP